MPMRACSKDPRARAVNALGERLDLYPWTPARRCARGRGGWLRFAWEPGIYGSDAGIGHDRMMRLRPSYSRRPGFGAAYARAGYCPHVVQCRTWAANERPADGHRGPGNR
jgi:hypothetical protein